MFKLQQFSIAQDQCAMKVCTDALLFGAMAPVKPGGRVIDIGTGTGLLSLMAMQRGADHVTAIELLAAPAQQARDNVQRSPWPNNIEVFEQDILNYHTTATFDLVISNPPFFDQHLKSDDSARNTARHTDTLSYQSLLAKSKQLLSVNGSAYFLVPTHAADQFIALAKHNALFLRTKTTYQSNESTPSKVCALLFITTENQVVNESNVVIYNSHQQYSEQSSALLAPYLLRFAKT